MSAVISCLCNCSTRTSPRLPRDVRWQKFIPYIHTAMLLVE